MNLFGPVSDHASVAHALDGHHYLGASKRGFSWSDEYGVLVLAPPTSRRLPSERWLELVRWCLTGERNAGSRQWSLVRAWLLEHRPEVTTVVSYSDPAAGHTGALYRASGWLWAPTWHRLRPPPSGHGRWKSRSAQSVKDRWVCVLRPDSRREALLRIEDDAVRRRFPDAEYREPRFRHDRRLGVDVPVGGTGGGRWRQLP